MPRVSIGVPVYNGASLIRECLDCLAAQTYADFEVVISDNASTDGTTEICSEFADRDPRFRHIRHPATIDMMENFLAARDATSGPLFMWRAFDDLAEPYFLSRLVALHDAHPGLRLAVGSVRQEFDGARPNRLIRYPISDSAPRTLRVLGHLFRGEASWFYGLWCHNAAEETLAAVRSLYSDPWGGDHLTLFHVAVQDGIRGDPEAIFRQRIISSTRGYIERPKPTYSEMTDRNARFAAAARAMLREAALDTKTRTLILALLPLYVNKRCHRSLRVAQAFGRKIRKR